MTQRVLVVIPAYNEEKSIASILEHLKGVAPEFDQVMVNEFVTRAVGATYPASALSLLAFVFIVAMLIFFSVQLSQQWARQMDLAQSLALSALLSVEAQQPAQVTAENTET